MILTWKNLALVATLLVPLGGCGPSVGSLYCGEACTDSLQCSGSLICRRGECAPPPCNDCGAAACTYELHADRTCSFVECVAP